MAKVLIFNICLVLILSRVESCFIPRSVYVPVPQTIPAGYEITKVDVADCDPKAIHLTLTDPSFTINSNGVIEALTPVSVATGGRTFSVWTQDYSGPESEMEVHLVYRGPTVLARQNTGQGLLKRTKRRWSPPPFNILENESGPFPREMETITSDSETTQQVYYTFTGPGYDKNPVGVFSLDRYTGMLSVHKPVDREEFPVFKLKCSVFNRQTNQPTDEPLIITINVDDVNDNAPTFKDPLQYTVLEHSNAGTVVGTVNSTDRDKQGDLHTIVRYSLLSGLDLFAINPGTGVITTKTNTLDREVKDKHMVLVQIKDMDGADNGLYNTGTATITLGDINDNPPTFTKTSYEASVNENENEKLLLRIPVEDRDLVNTPNWISKFVLTKGNENGNFRIDTDPKTNEGLLYVSKPLDYEQTKNVKIQVMARNQAELSDPKLQWRSVPVNLTVNNVDEGPQFTAPTVRFIVKENVPNGTVIGTYAATDPETKSSNGIKYYKTTDPASWINVDRNTGELKVANTIDRESQFAKDGIYNVTMKAVDASSKTGTGTVIIVVEDVNDNMPVLPTGELVLCEKEGERGSLLVVAEDKDQSPFSSPFSFSLPQNNDGSWSVTRFNDTAATLQQVKELPTGIHNVPMDVTDLQGFGTTQTAKVRICQCRNGACLAKQSSVSLGALALLAMLLPLALLLLLGVLLAIFCVTRREKLELDDAEDSGGNLLKSNTEAPGEEVDSSFLTVPMHEQTLIGSVKGAAVNAGWLGNNSSSTMGANTTRDIGMYNSGVHITNDLQGYYGHYDSQYGTQQMNGGNLLGSSVGFDSRFQSSALHRTWETNGRYLHKKLVYLGTEEDGRYADDIIHSYGFEGVGSAAGSVGCCSDIGDNDNLDFLNTLGPKFKTLADACTNT